MQRRFAPFISLALEDKCDVVRAAGGRGKKQNRARAFVSFEISANLWQREATLTCSLHCDNGAACRGDEVKNARVTRHATQSREWLCTTRITRNRTDACATLLL